MKKEQYWSVIRFFFLDGKTCEEIKVKLYAVYKDHATSMTTIRYSMNHRWNRGLFWGVRQIIFFGWYKNVGISLD